MDKNLLERLLDKFRKPKVSEGTIFLHDREMMNAQSLAKTAEAIDSEKFGKPEFLLLIKLKFCLLKGLEGYEGLSDSIQLLQVAIAAKDIFIALDQTEFQYRSSKQQELYKFVEMLLNQQENRATFYQQVKTKLEELLLQIKTDEGKLALRSYGKNLETLADRDLGLKLLSLFKAYQLDDYSILKAISNMIDSLGKNQLHDLNTVMAAIMVNYSIFEKVGRIIGISQKRSNPETYAQMIQYIALAHKHKLSFLKFEELMQVMQRWYFPYQNILMIRQEHPPKEYRQPREFFQDIPGETLYLKYKKWLTDQQTGYTYLEFEEGQK